MDRQDIVKAIAEIVEVPALTGRERLIELEGWDSIAVMSFIAMVDDRLNKSIPGASISECQTVDDLVNLCLA